VLTSVPGIGRKGAERLVVELRDKVGAVAPRGTADPASGGGATRIQVVEALVGLGFAVRQAEQAVEAVLGEGSDGGHADTSAVLRSALSRLGRNR
jgi:Holliday junction DNA helicase RuvA